MRFDDKVVLITGAARGLGETTARMIAAEGGKLVLADRDRAGLQAVIDSGVPALAVTVDLTSGSAVKEMADAALREHGRIDVLINCAGGYSNYRGFIQLAETDWDQTIESNLKSSFLCCQAVLPSMIGRRYGRIVNVASVAARSYSYFLGAAYTAAKAGVLGLTRQIAHEFGPQGICANAVAPTAFHGERLHGMLSAEQAQQITALTPLRRIPQAAEIASAIAFLASDEARFVSGATLDVNGALITA